MKVEGGRIENVVTTSTRYAKKFMKPVTHVMRTSALSVNTEHRVPLEPWKIQNVQRAEQGSHALPEIQQNN